MVGCRQRAERSSCLTTLASNQKPARAGDSRDGDCAASSVGLDASEPERERAEVGRAVVAADVVGLMSWDVDLTGVRVISRSQRDDSVASDDQIHLARREVFERIEAAGGPLLEPEIASISNGQLIGIRRCDDFVDREYVVDTLARVVATSVKRAPRDVEEVPLAPVEDFRADVADC